MIGLFLGLFFSILSLQRLHEKQVNSERINAERLVWRLERSIEERQRIFQTVKLMLESIEGMSEEKLRLVAKKLQGALRVDNVGVANSCYK